MEAITTSPQLPPLDDRRVAVRISADGLRQVRGGHPWVFDRAVRSVSHDAAPGALAVIFDDRRRFAAIGLWDPTSPIRIRVLHAGAPRQIDGAFWAEQLSTALARRHELADDPTTTGYRCVHGENDGFPGLVVDRYEDVAVVKVYTAAWLPHLADVVDPLVELTGVRAVVLRQARSVEDGAAPTPTVLFGSRPDGPVPFLEGGLWFEADVVHGQKTGHFLDQRENRALVGGLSAGARVLDTFCCTGGFTVHAAAGGATSVDSVDLSEPALRAVVRNLARNGDRPAVRGCAHRTVEGDAFAVLEAMAGDRRRFDVVVVDPPSFASRADQVDRARRAYARLTGLALDVLSPGGILVQSSCSSRVTEDDFHATVLGAARASGRSVEEWARTGHAADHPVGFPEGRYLKTTFLRVG